MLFYYTPSHGTAEMAQALAASCPGGETTPSLSVVNTILEDIPEGQVIFILSEPQSQIMQALTRSSTPQDALISWQSQAHPILDAKRLHRKQITLVWAHEAVAYPQELAKLCSLDTLTLDAALAPEPLDPLMQLIAQHTLSTSPDAMALYEELMASAPDLSNGATLANFEPDAALNAYKNSKITAQKKAAQVTLLQGILTQTNQELSKNAQEFGVVQAELTQSNARLEQSEQDYVDSQSELNKLTVSYTTLTAEKASLQKTIDALRISQDMQKEHNSAMAQELTDLELQKQQLGQRLDQVNQGMDSYHAQVGNLRQSLEEGKSQNKDLNKTVIDLEHNLRAEEEKIRRIMNSRSIRLTSPIRKFGNLLRWLRRSRS